MKLFILFLLLTVLSVNVSAQLKRAPAVVGGDCDLEISTTTNKLQKESAKNFTQEVAHKIIIHADDGAGCSSMPQMKYPLKLYEEYVRNEMKVLFQKYPENYSKKCVKYFKGLGLKKSDFICDEPVILSIAFQNFGCEKKTENETLKISYAAFSDSEIRYVQVGTKFEEKKVEIVQKELCARVNECMEEASKEKLTELKKLSAVACKSELTPVSTARAPAIENDSSFDGNRKSKTNLNKDEQQKNPEPSSSVLK